MTASHPRYQAASAALLRAAVHPDIALPPWPDLTDTTEVHVVAWRDWLRQVWDTADVADAVEAASPDFADAVQSLYAAACPGAKETRRVVLTMIRYLQRMRGRCTPAGLLAGVAPVSFAPEPRVRWGSAHHAVARAGGEWLAKVTALAEREPGLLGRLPVMVNTTAFVRGDRLIVPYQARAGQGHAVSAAEVSLRLTAPVQAVIGMAGSPILMSDLAAKLTADFPGGPQETVTAMLAGLVAHRALITGLHAPATETDALAHLLSELKTADVGGLAGSLADVQQLIQRHNRAPADDARTARRQTVARMRSVAGTRQHPLAIDVRLDVDVVLPAAVAHEAERAAVILARLSAYPAGTPAWKAYHQRFYERYGLGSLVPLLDVVSDSGIGWPDGYPGTPAPPRAALSRRDELLLALAGEAVTDRRDEVVLDEPLITALGSTSVPLRLPSHLELGVRIHTVDLAALRRGDFTLHNVAVSRAAGVLTGRFLPVLAPADQDVLADELTRLPCSDSGTIPVQLSFPPLDPATAHVTRAPRILKALISLGEHRPPGPDVLTAADLAVGCDGRRMYLAVPSWGMRVEASAPHPLNLVKHTPPLARLVTELSRAQCAQVTTFDWGAAAHLPFLPRIRAGRTILSPSRWRLTRSDLPRSAASWQDWNRALEALLARRRTPRMVYLAEGDQRLPLDLGEDAHRAVLRAHLSSAPAAIVTEAPAQADLGWCGSRPHEVIIPLRATRPPRWPQLTEPSPARVLGGDYGHLPGTSDVLLVSLYCEARRQDDILCSYLPDLLARLPQPPSWWFIRYRDPDQQIRLRITLPSAEAFGQTARTISTWAGEVRDAGLLRDMAFPVSRPETGRWGSGVAWTAAEAVFQTDSSAVLTQLRIPQRPARRPLAAAHAVAIAAVFTGSRTAGMQWLLDHVPAPAPARIPRPILDQARQLADPAGNWAALRSEPGGCAIVDRWAARDQALARYRAYLGGPDMTGIAADDVLSSLLHVNYVRGHGIDFDDEAVCLYLARAAALSAVSRVCGGGS
jgi:lantibiotic biosynthesis protein